MHLSTKILQLVAKRRPNDFFNFEPWLYIQLQSDTVLSFMYHFVYWSLESCIAIVAVFRLCCYFFRLMTSWIRMLLENLEKNMVKREMKEPPKHLTNCSNRLEIEDCHFYHYSTPHTLSCSFISAQKNVSFSYFCHFS